MKVLSLLLACICVPILAADKSENAKKELEKLQGEWHVVAVSVDGKSRPWMDLKDITAAVKGQSLSSQLFTKMQGSSFRRADKRPADDPARRPVLPSIVGKKDEREKAEEIPLTFQLGAAANAIDAKFRDFDFPGIYAFDGEKLTLSLGLPKSDRPKDLSAGADRLVIGLERKRTANESRDKAVKESREKLKGVWAVQSGLYDQSNLTADELKGFRLTFGESVKWEEAGMEETLAIDFDPTSTPAAVNFTVTAGPRKGTVIQGIFELKQDTFTLCLPFTSNFSRPEDMTKNLKFRADAVLVLKRMKP